MIQKVEIERFSVVSAKPFDEVVAGIGAAVSHPNMAEFWKSTKQAQSLSEFEDIINKITGSSGLMQFEQLNPARSFRPIRGERHGCSVSLSAIRSL